MSQAQAMPSAWRIRACGVALSLLLTLFTAVTTATAQTAAWPHTVTVEGASATIYQPQAISWPDHETLTARAAIAVTPAAAVAGSAGAPDRRTFEPRGRDAMRRARWHAVGMPIAPSPKSRS